MSVHVARLFDAFIQLQGLSSIDLDAIESFMKQIPKLETRDGITELDRGEPLGVDDVLDSLAGGDYGCRM